MDKQQVNMSTMISRSISLAALLLSGIYSYQVQAVECIFEDINTSTISAGTLVVNSYNPSRTTPVLLGTLSAGNYAYLNCSTGNDGSDFYGKSTTTSGTQSDSYTSTSGSTKYSYNRVFFPTSIPGIYYNIYIANSINANYTAYLPSNTSWTREIDNAANGDFPVGLYIEVWQRGGVSSIGNGEAHPVINGEIGRFKAGGENVSSQQIIATVNASSFTVKFAAPTCNLSVSPATIDFGDVGNDKPRKTFTLKNSNCVNASGVTLKLTSAKAAYDNSGLSILANTTTGTSAAGGRGVAVSYEGSSRQYLSANDTNSSVTIGFGSIVTAKDITMAGLLTCTSVSNNSTCDDYIPGAFTAAGTISATYK
ncbi:TPA: pilus assembly protein FimA [Citrobacter pasteurii]|nr:pilus assembly protein FimA [Citrobacter pasteurii]HEF0064910.1 pilus assembly protein FimA [Citrobacter pasteurii]